MTPVNITVTVSEPYRTIGYHGGHYGQSQFKQRDYTATYQGRTLQMQNKSSISARIKMYARQRGEKAILTFIPE